MDRFQNSRRLLILSALLIGFIGFAYYPLLHSEFVNYDDTEYITINRHVTGGLTLRNVRWALTTGYAANWHPLTWLSHMLDVELFGMRPGWHHFTNLALHTANTLLLFGLLRFVTGAVWRSWAVAALFAVHPLHVESVAWVAERKDVLSTFFFLGALWAYVKYVRLKREPTVISGRWSATKKRSVLWYGLALVLFALGLMSKPMLVTLPFVLLLLDYWPLGRMEDGICKTEVGIAAKEEGKTNNGEGKREQKEWRKRIWLRLVVEKTPFFFLTVISSVITFLVQRSGHAMDFHITFLDRLSNAIISYGSYLAKAVWPAKLSVFYPHPATAYGHPGSWPAWEIALMFALVVAVSFVAWRERERRGWLLIGWLWYLGTLVPVIGIVQVGGQSLADRYTYIPLIGIFVAAIWSAAEFIRARPAIWAICLPVAVCLPALCVAVSHKQVTYWKNTRSLFEHAVSVDPSNALGYTILGQALVTTGKTNAGIATLERALALSPALVGAHSFLGNAYDLVGKPDLALKEYRTTAALWPWYYIARKDLAGQLWKMGQREEALEQCREAQRLHPDDPEALINLGGMLWQLGQKEEATRQYEEAIRVDPTHPVAHYNLGLGRAAQGRWAEAETAYREAIRLNHDYVEALTALGRLLTLQGRLSEAPAPFRQLAHLQPTNTDFQINLGSALFMANRTNEAAEAFAAALRLRPNLPRELVQQGESLLKQGQRDAAIARATTALRIQPDFAAAHAFLDSINAQASPNKP